MRKRVVKRKIPDDAAEDTGEEDGDGSPMDEDDPDHDKMEVVGTGKMRTRGKAGTKRPARYREVDVNKNDEANSEEGEEVEDGESPEDETEDFIRVRP